MKRLTTRGGFGGIAGIAVMVMVARLAGAQDGSWTTKAPMPTAREHAAAATVGDMVYVIGGIVGNTCQGIGTVEAYDPATDHWAARAPMPTSRWEPGVAVVNGMIYVIGGGTGCGSDTAVVEAYDPVTNTWSSKAPLPLSRAAPAAGAVDGLIYAAGGSSSASGTIFADLQIYDPATDAWTIGPPMPTPRTQAAVGVVNDVLYVAAGCCVPEAATRLESYDPAAGAWTTRASLSQARVFQPAGASLNGKFYVIGGNFAGPRHEVEVYDPAAGLWSFVAPMPTARTEAAAAAANGRIHVVGGDVTGSDDVTALNEVFEPGVAPPADVTPPLATLHMSPGVLWPPNHELVPVTAVLDASDDSGSFVVEGPFVVSSEAMEGTGDGDASPDWVIDSTYQVRFRAERGGPGRGRVYTITYIVRDPSGNSVTVAGTVKVPHGGR